MYVRQSQDKTGNEAAVDRQEESCRQLALAKGWDDLTVYRDNDRSATSGKERPEFERLIRDIEAGTVSALLVWHLDRLTRSIRDLTRIIEAGRAQRVNIASVHGVSLDLGDPTGVAVATILTAISAMEVQHKGNRQKAANRQRATQGKAQWVRRPYGYVLEDGVARMVPEEAEALRDAADRVLAGATLSSIVRDWNGQGRTTTAEKPWNVTALRRSLINPRTAGRRLYNGDDLGVGDWDPIFTADLHQVLEEKLSDPRRRTAPDDLNSKYLLSGICMCGKCGKKMFAAPVKSGEKQWMVYKCQGGYCMTRRLDLVDEVVEGVVVELLSSEHARHLFISSDDTHELRKRATDLRDRRDALASMLADGLLSASAVREQAGKLSNELAAAEDAIASADTLDPLSSLIGSADVERTWQGLTLSTKRQIIRSIMDVTILPAGKGVRFTPEQVQARPKGQAV